MEPSPSPANKTYRQLNAALIIDTVATLKDRISERFPDSGLSRLVADLEQVANETVSRIQWIQRPHLPLRVGVFTLSIVIVALFLFMLRNCRTLPLNDFANLMQAIDGFISSTVYIGAAILFLITWETRIKRTRALRAIHELRSMAHIVDMHQLTKDPERAFNIGTETASSPKRPMKPFELSRYLDYCSEALSLIGKIAALHVQGFQDSVVLDAVDDMEDLTTGISRKVWQKITLIDLMQKSNEERS